MSVDPTGAPAETLGVSVARRWKQATQARGTIRRRRVIATLVLGFALLLPAGAPRAEIDTSGSVDVEVRLFADDPAFAGQEGDTQASLVLRPEWEWKSDDRRQFARVAPYFRLDGRDDERTHFDLREGFFQWIFDEWELLAG